ncbi:MAG: adenine glycosylase [Coriobacteriia bacterium]|nr:adenine glycosylase [Coriobacteriia bacterium]
MARCDGPIAADIDVAGFSSLVRSEGEAHWRELPWRGIDDDYGVLVSEVMLQQTQVKRVIGYWERFMGMFPTIDALAAADNALVLELWQGLGYNRRALMLKKCAEECAASHDGALPRSYAELIALPGIGPSTAAGVLAFARNEPCVYLETNVRSVFLHHFFPDAPKVPDKHIIPLVERTCPKEDVRGWYYALLDYGAYLKSIMPNPSRRSAAYSRQSRFEGSRRQKRAHIVRIVLANPGIMLQGILDALEDIERKEGRPGVDEREVASIIDDLVSEGFFTREGEGYRA